MRMAKVAVLIDESAANRRWAYGLNVFEAYIIEVLAHAGIPHVQVGAWDEGVDRADILIAALTGDDAETATRMWTFAERGGAVISYGGLDRLAGPLGCVPQQPLHEAYARLPERLGDARPLRALNVKPWMAGEQAHRLRSEAGLVASHPAHESKCSVLQTFAVGQGVISRFSVNIPYTIAIIQQGTAPILEDGVPAPDGSAHIDEGILKADDGIALDWNVDRAHSDSGQPYFPHPYADLWREACIAQLLQTAVGKGLTLPFIGYWPDGIRSVATVSHDSDGNVEAGAERTLDVLQDIDIRSTWCILEPGYSRDMYRNIQRGGHELAFHYNGLESQGGVWGPAEFHRQLAWLRAAAPDAPITTNKNHYTRFEGWGELFQWCEDNGITVDQSRGPSKGGNVGFLFGTCHAYFPAAWSNERNRLYDVLEIGFLTQDMDIGSPWADSTIISPFLEQVGRVEGIAHFLFHQAHIQTKPRVIDALRSMVQEARQRGFAFWTSRDIDRWERSRRAVLITGLDEQGGVIAESAADLDDVVIWIPVVQERAAAAGAELKFGVPCVKQVCRFRPDTERSRPDGTPVNVVQGI